MRVNEILPGKAEEQELTEEMLQGDTGLPGKAVLEILKAEKGEWSKGMTAEEVAKQLGI